MTDVFKQQKINLNDVSNPHENLKTLEQGAAIRALASGEPQQAPFAMSGNMPKEMLDALAQQKGPQSQPPQPRFAQGAMVDENYARLMSRLTNTIYEEITLPSKGRFYDGTDGPEDGILHIRKMTGADEQILATPKFAKKGIAMNMIFNQCIQECQTKGYRSENFLSVDRTYLLIFLRGISYGLMYEVEVKCPECERKFNDQINLGADINVNTCPNNFDISNLIDTLPQTEFNFGYRLRTGKDELDINNHRERRSSGFTGVEDDSLIYTTALLLDNIEGVKDKATLMEVIKKLPVSDVNYLRNVINEPPFGMDTKIPCICDFCSFEFSVELPLETNFFFPKTKKDIKNPA